MTAGLYKNNVNKNDWIFGSPSALINSGSGSFANLSVLEPGNDYQYKLSVNTTPPSTYSSVTWTPVFNVTDRRFTVLIKQHIGDCNDTVICGSQPIIQIRNHHPDTDAKNLDGVWTVTAFISNSSSPHDTTLLGNTSLAINNQTGLASSTDLGFSKPAANMTLKFVVNVVPHEYRFANMSAVSQVFDIKPRLLCLKEIIVPMSPLENQLFTRQPLLHVVDCATDRNAVHIDPISVTASFVGDSHNLTGNTTVMTEKHFIVNFTNLILGPWKANATLLYSSSNLHRNVSFVM